MSKKYRTSKPRLMDGWACFAIHPDEWVEFKMEMQSIKPDKELSIEVKRYYKKRTKSQLDCVFGIARRIITDEHSSAYDKDASDEAVYNLFTGIKYRAVDFGFPVTKVQVGKVTKTVPKSASNDSDLTTKEMSTLVETAINVASEAGADIRDILDELEGIRSK